MSTVKDQTWNRTRIRSAFVAVVSLFAMVLSAAPASADPVGSPAWDCTPGYSCYFDYDGGYNKLFTAARCGEHDLRGGVYQNRISSIANYGNGQVRVYNWRNAGYWELHGWVNVGATGSFYTNIIDRIVIDC